jgi:acyl-coenzyme A thioesterase PaaI-like protein
MPAVDPEAEARCRASFARQQATTTIGAPVEKVAAGEVELAMPFCEKLTRQHAKCVERRLQR